MEKLYGREYFFKEIVGDETSYTSELYYAHLTYYYKILMINLIYGNTEKFLEVLENKNLDELMSSNLSECL